MRCLSMARAAVGLSLATLLACGGDGQPSGTAEGTQAAEPERDDDGAAVESKLDFGELDARVSAFVEERELAGMSLAVVAREQGVVHLRGFGEHAPDRVYALASATKILTAGVVMRLDDQGVVDIDAPIGEYVADAWGEGKATLTLAQLLSMSAGLVGLDDTGYEPYACVYELDGTVEDCAAQIYRADDSADVIAPDTEFRYGGQTYQLAGGVGIVASGKSWEALLRETYIEPCGVDSLGYTNFSDTLAYPSDFQGDPSHAPRTKNYLMGGGAYISAPHYATLLLMHLRRGLCDDKRVLSEGAVARMQVDRIGEVYSGDTGNRAFAGYGLGFYVDRQNGVVVDLGAFGSGVWIDSKLGYGAFVGMESVAATGSDLIAELLPLLSEMFGGQYTPATTEERDTPDLTNAQCLERQGSLPDACQQCACERCLSESAPCLAFDEGGLCDEYFACYWAHYAECQVTDTGWVNCIADLDGNIGAGPCAQETYNAGANERGAAPGAVFSGACNQAPTDNACAAMVALRGCMQSQCPEVCVPD